MDEADFIPLSALQHYVFCPRQCALIHIEQIWQENGHTAEGHLFHKTVHAGGAKTRKGVRTETDLQIKSYKLGITGRTDAVEFKIVAGKEVLFPIEYKKGSAKNHITADSIQLCAEALCLEEMLHVTIPAGALYYGEMRRRVDVEFNNELRKKTEEIAKSVHKLFDSRETPPPCKNLNCSSCSLNESCLPAISSDYERSALYLEKLWEDSL